MADEKLTDLPAAGPITDADALYVVQGGVSSQTPASAIKTYAATPIPSGSWVEISRAVAAGDATIEFTQFDNTLYDHYQVDAWGFQPDTSDSFLYMRTSSDGGSTWDQGSSDYDNYYNLDNGSGYPNWREFTYTAFVFSPFDFLGSTPFTARQLIELTEPGAAAYCLCEWRRSSTDTNSPLTSWRTDGFGWRKSTSPVNAIQLQIAGANIATGTFSFRGRRR